MQNSFYAAVNHVTDLSGNKYDISERSTGHAPGLWLEDFDPFCLFQLLDAVMIMIDSSVKRNRKFGLNFQVSMLLKSAIMITRVRPRIKMFEVIVLFLRLQNDSTQYRLQVMENI